jgi:hypothetical protein
MNHTDIPKIRLRNQQITGSHISSPKKLVGWMGAMQAQDYEMVKWAIGMRLPGATVNTIERAIEDGDIIRTHLLRPTWHFVAADDLRWMLELTAPHIKSSMQSRHKQLGLTDKIIAKSNRIIRDCFSNGQPLTRKELVKELENAGFRNEDNRAAHLFLRAELDGIIGSGPSQKKHHTYILIDERFRQMTTFSREEALGKLARTYFSSHGPATIEDFIWWSGLPVKDARDALEIIRKEFISETIGSQTFLLSENLSFKKEKSTVFLNPAYDEFLISYKDRSASIKETNQRKAISNNGIFRPVILVNGEVAGIWKRTVQPSKVIIETTFFKKPDHNIKEQTQEAARQFAVFLGKEVEIRHSKF